MLRDKKRRRPARKKERKEEKIHIFQMKIRNSNKFPPVNFYTLDVFGLIYSAFPLVFSFAVLCYFAFSLFYLLVYKTKYWNTLKTINIQWISHLMTAERENYKGIFEWNSRYQKTHPSRYCAGECGESCPRHSAQIKEMNEMVSGK